MNIGSALIADPIIIFAFIYMLNVVILL